MLKTMLIGIAIYQTPPPVMYHGEFTIIGNNKPVQVNGLFDALQKTLGKKAKINFLPLQPGDVPDTYASVDNLKKEFKYKYKNNS